MEQRFTSRQVVDLTGITPRQLQWWDEKGIVTPVHEGHRRFYSLDDVAEVSVICELRKRGFSLQRMRKVMRFLQQEFGRRLVDTVTAGSEFHLLTDGTHIYLRNSAEQVLDILKGAHQPMFAVCLSDTVRQVKADLRELAIEPTKEIPQHASDSDFPPQIDPNRPRARSKSNRKRTPGPLPARRPVARAGQSPSASDRRKAVQ